jgi:hypothetical protein
MGATESTSVTFNKGGNMDLKQILQELHFGAQHFTPEEKRFFDGVWENFKRRGNIADVHAPHVLELYRKLKFREIDVNALLSDLEANLLLLADDEQAKVAGARMALEYDGGQLDPKSVEILLKVRKALADRQHTTLAGRGELAAQRPAPATVRPPVYLPPPLPPRALQPPPAAPRQLPRKNTRSAPLGHVSALEAAAKLLKRGR